jgi:hypothetical protein
MHETKIVVITNSNLFDGDHVKIKLKTSNATKISINSIIPNRILVDISLLFIIIVLSIFRLFTKTKLKIIYKNPASKKKKKLTKNCEAALSLFIS